MWIGILFNVGLIAIFKYADFAISTVNDLSALNIGLLGIALPLGISFFTFTQIAWLVDMHAKPKKPRFWNYLLFVSFFPHLIAGPILHHAEMMPQFDRIVSGRPQRLLLAILDQSRGRPDDLHHRALQEGDDRRQLRAHCDRRLQRRQAGKDIRRLRGMGRRARLHDADLFRLFRLFRHGGRTCPDVRHPPADQFLLARTRPTSIIEFWRRWHMTLSRFLRDYIYFPLGGSRRGASRRYVNLMTTMLVGGLWHGASWTFVLWGGLARRLPRGEPCMEPFFKPPLARRVRLAADLLCRRQHLGAVSSGRHDDRPQLYNSMYSTSIRATHPVSRGVLTSIRTRPS